MADCLCLGPSPRPAASLFYTSGDGRGVILPARPMFRRTTEPGGRKSIAQRFIAGCRGRPLVVLHISEPQLRARLKRACAGDFSLWANSMVGRERPTRRKPVAGLFRSVGGRGPGESRERGRSPPLASIMLLAQSGKPQGFGDRVPKNCRRTERPQERQRCVEQGGARAHAPKPHGLNARATSVRKCPHAIALPSAQPGS